MINNSLKDIYNSQDKIFNPFRPNLNIQTCQSAGKIREKKKELKLTQVGRIDAIFFCLYWFSWILKTKLQVSALVKYKVSYVLFFVTFRNVTDVSSLISCGEVKKKNGVLQ